MSDEKLKVFIDGECPLCRREGEYIKKRGAECGTVEVVDISSKDFKAEDYGLNSEAVQKRIHVILPNGEIVEGPRVFVEVYEKLGLGWTVRWIKLPIIKNIVSFFYDRFANNRIAVGNFLKKFGIK